MSTMTATALPEDNILLRSDQGGVATLTLNRPKSGNSLSHDLVNELQKTFQAIAKDPSVRVIIITANGRLFCTGHDLNESLNTKHVEDKRAANIVCASMLQTMLDLPQPIIAKVQGVATAAGCELVATCDLAIASESSKFATPGVNIGLWCLSPQVAVSRTISPKHAMQMLLSGKLINAETAARFGLINEAVPDKALDARVNELTRDIASKSSYTVALGKESFYRQLEMSRRDAYNYVNEVMIRAFNSKDAEEGITAFLEKRKPEWEGR